MALLTKGQTRTAVRQAIDDPSAALWSDANLDILISLAGDTMWQAVIDTFPWAQSVQELETTSAAGVVLLSALTAGRFYRIQKITRDSDALELHPKLFTEKVPQPAYHMLGDTIVTDPAIVSLGVTITYSVLPTKFNDLANDATTLTGYPEGHEAALIYVAASWAMTKGDRESMAQIARLADLSVEALLQHIARRYPVAAQRRIPSIKQQILRNPILPAAGA